MKRTARVAVTWLAVMVVGLAGFAYFGTDEAKDVAWDNVSKPFVGPPGVIPWSDGERGVLASLSLAALGNAPLDPTNQHDGDPLAIRLGHQLFFDTRFSATGGISCATCHQPARAFTDGLGKGAGIGFSKRNTRTLLGVTHSPWQYWDGRRDTLWAQALTPIEDHNEHGISRTEMVTAFAAEPQYRSAWQEIVGSPLPEFADVNRFPVEASPLGVADAAAAWERMTAFDRQQVNRVFAHLGKFIAAYEAILLPGPDPLEAYLKNVAQGQDEPIAKFGAEAIAGLRLFVGKARCIECHNGPLLTNNEFHNTGVLSAPGELPDRGRVDGVRLVAADPFNCMSLFSDDNTCAELRYRRSGVTTIGATRTPTLRGVTVTAPYMHKGQIATLAEVVDHYDFAEEALVGHNEAKPLRLTPRESRHLIAFLETLTFGMAIDPAWLAPPESGRNRSLISAAGAWARATPPGSTNAAVYLTLSNAGRAAITIADVESEVGVGMFHHTREVEGMAHMDHLDEVELPAGGRVELRPGGMHIMLMRLTAPLVAGERFTLQLYPTDGEAIEVEVEVRGLTWLPGE